jgi:hypothetical protein
MPIPALMGWIGGLSAGAKLSIASSVVSGLSSYAAAKAQRKQAIADQDNQYVRMRNAAQRAGFNPLTVLRATGGQGFTGLPVISKAAAFGNMAAGIFDAVRQSPIDKYNKEIRGLEKKQRKASIDNTISNTAYTGILANQARAANVDPYAGYDKYIPVRVGNNVQQLEKTVAKRLGIEPNDALMVEDMEAIRGDVRATIDGVVQTEIADQVLIPAPLTGTAGTGQNKPPALASNFDLFVGKMTNVINSMPNTPVIPPFSNPAWGNEYKKYLN